eukprot:3809563-Rhodomonas_salina.3
MRKAQSLVQSARGAQRKAFDFALPSVAPTSPAARATTKHSAWAPDSWYKYTLPQYHEQIRGRNILCLRTISIGMDSSYQYTLAQYRVPGNGCLVSAVVPLA